MLTEADAINKKGKSKLSRIILVLWPLVLLAPLVPVPAPSVLIGLPWKPELILSVILACSLCVLLFHRKALSFDPLFIAAPMLLLILWSGVSVFWAPSTHGAIHHTLAWAIYLVFFSFARGQASDRRWTKYSLYGLAAVAFVISFNCCLEWLLRERIDPTFGYRYGRYAEIWATLLPLALAITLRAKGRRLVLAILLTSLLWLAVLFSTSRGSLAASVVGLTIFGIFAICFKAGRRRWKTILLAGAWLLILGFVTQLPSIVAPNDLRKSTFTRATSGPDVDASNSLSRNIRFLFLATGTEMWRQNNLLGVGADNYGISFAKYRAAISAKPENQELVRGNEDAIPERAHNEYVQIAAELGTPGILIFAAFLLGVAWQAFRVLRRSPNLYHLAAVAGMIAFLLSSAVSSFSFRLVQNGVVFLFLAAILFAGRTVEKRRPGLLTILGLLGCIAMAVFSSLKGTSQYFASRGENLSDPSEAIAAFRTAERLDPTNAGADFAAAGSALNNFSYREAASQYESAIDKGIATSAAYSYLISAYSLEGDDKAALEAASRAVQVFPYSPFILTRYSILAENAGLTNEAERYFEKARSLDPAQADTWRILIREGSKKAAEDGRTGVGVPLLVDLYPQDGLYAVLAERQIRHPEERFSFDAIR